MALVEILKSTGFEQVGDIVDFRGDIEAALAEGVIRLLDVDPRIVKVEPVVEAEDAPPADVVGDVEEVELPEEPIIEDQEEIEDPEVIAEVEGEDK